MSSSSSSSTPPRPFSVDVHMLRRVFGDCVTPIPTTRLIALIERDLDLRDKPPIDDMVIQIALEKIYFKHWIAKLPEGDPVNDDAIWVCPRIKKGCVGVKKDGTLVMRAPAEPKKRKPPPLPRPTKARRVEGAAPKRVMHNPKLSETEMLRRLLREEPIPDSRDS